MPNKPPDRFLTDDEVLEFPVRGNDTPFRIRIWRGRERPPFVVVSQVIQPEGHWAGPSQVTLEIANHVDSVMLGTPLLGMMYLEDELDQDGVPTLTCYGFNLDWKGSRRWLHSPSRRVRPWDFVEHVLRQKVERWA
jgi:hypothetical protein